MGMSHVMSMPSLTAFSSAAIGGSGGPAAAALQGGPADAANWTHPPQPQLLSTQQLLQYHGLQLLNMPAAAAAGGYARGGGIPPAGGVGVAGTTCSEDGSLSGPRGFRNFSPAVAHASGHFAPARFSFSTGGSAAIAAASPQVGGHYPHPHHHNRRLSMPVGALAAAAAASPAVAALMQPPVLDVSGVDPFAAAGIAGQPSDVLRGGLATPRWHQMHGSSGDGSMFTTACSGMGMGMGSSFAVSDVGAVSPAAMMAAASLGDRRQLLVQLGAIAQDGSRGYKYRMSDNGGGGRSFLQRAATCSLPGTLTAAAAAATQQQQPPRGSDAAGSS
jgi:hypothetical protein